MRKIDLQRRLLGVNFNKDKEAQALVWAPLSKQVYIIQEESAKEIPLNKEDYGYWSLKTNEIKPGDNYLLKIDEDKQLPDPASLAQPMGVHEASQAIDLSAFSWKDAGWNNHDLEDYLIYELHTGTFNSSNNFKGIIDKLDHLKEMGITAIEIMPVAQFPGNRNWGYDGVYPFAVQFSYGGADGLMELVDACHQKGIAVILDVVYNHFGPEGNYFGEFGPYFTDKYNTPWGKAINFDDAWCDAVRHYFIENVLMWFRDFHIDALRLDAVHAIKDFSPVHILKEIKQYTDLLMKETGRRHYLIAELDLNDTRYINPLEKDGYGIDSQWIDEFHHALYVSSGGKKEGYYTDFEGVTHLAKAYNDAYVYDGQYSPHRFKTFGVKATEHPGQQFIAFSQNHDQVGNRMLGERAGDLFSVDMQKLRAAAVLVSPFIPMLFMGEEYAESNPFQYFVSHTDPELAEAVRKGRKAEFEAFHLEGEAPDPMAAETFNNSQLQWDLLGEKEHQMMLNYYKMLIQLRKEHPALKSGIRKDTFATADETKQTLILVRKHETEDVYCLMNFSATSQLLELSEEDCVYEKVADSAASEWGGKSTAPETISMASSVLIEPESIVIYTCKHV
ncbi:MAG: malto-oligosyltrehalose trehalohydrolase [Pedobacter sp.]|nr:MAG: malto-oligosyltrehalose trehalohydrolase [Pedobacter sp.]